MKKKETTEMEIINRIRQSLEGYEEPYTEGAWENFLRIRRAKRRRSYGRIASGIAACLLMGLIGLNLLRPETAIEPQLSAVPQGINQPAVPMAEGTSSLKPLPAEAGKIAVAMAKTAKIVKAPGTLQAPGSINLLVAENPANDSVNQPSQGKEKEGEKQAVILMANPSKKPDVQETATARAKRDTTAVQTEPLLLTAETLQERNKSTEGPKRKVRFGFNFSPGLNGSQSTASLKYMGGVSADIPLSSKFQLTTGLQVENQNIVKEYQGIVASSTTPQNEMKTELISLDVPVNLTWKFIAEKSHAWYVSAGLSSLVYLRQETVNTTYSQDLIPVSSMLNGQEVKTYSVVDRVSVTQDTSSPAQTIDVAGKLNLMVGFERKLTNRFYLHIEPYTKIPTSSQSAGSLNYTTSGINFKISF